MIKKILLLLISVLLVYGFSGLTHKEDDDLQKKIADKILRFHVIANSDSDGDQALKLKVKDAVVEFMKPLLSNCDDVHKSKEIVKAYESHILSVAQNVIRENGYNYDVHINYENCYFPAKKYGDISFPPGNYDAIRIYIGKHQGKNWWCVLYPPLCFVDCVNSVVPDESKEQLECVLGYDDYRRLIYGCDDVEVEYQFKILKFLN